MADTSLSHPSLDLSSSLRIHIVGIGGAGMSAIAEVLVGMGHTVSGSDLKDSPVLDRLRALGIATSVGHDASHIAGAAEVARSTAIRLDNPEVVAAVGAGIPVRRRSEVLAAITQTRRSISVAGTHGKTTTSSMLALALRGAGLAPSFIIGGDLNEIGSGAAWDVGDWLVVEADESDGTFLDLDSSAAIVTSVEPDHLDHYGSEAALREAFQRFVSGIDGPVVVCADDEGAAALTGPGIVSYGTSDLAEVRMVGLQTGPSGSTFDLHRGSTVIGSFTVPVPGAHNARNAAGAAVLSIEIGADSVGVAEGLAGFAGVARRFQFRGEAAGVTFIDDYAHLPTEVAAALSAAADGDWNRIVCVFQPHRFSRTSAVGADFGTAFDVADLVVVTDIYSAGETPIPGVTGRIVSDSILAHRPWRRLAYLPHRSDLHQFLTSELREGDLCLTLGAGDLTSLPDELREALA